MEYETKRVFLDPLIDDNPVTLQILGICSALAVTTSLVTSLIMCLALTVVLACSNVSISMIRKHIPSHNAEAIVESLNLELGVINYKNLNNDKGGLKQIMDLAVEGKILQSPIDINAFANDQFRTKITVTP